VTQAGGMLLDALPHALRLIAGEADAHSRQGRSG
jgi:hypothetical protein